jgi:hypothetical protein
MAFYGNAPLPDTNARQPATTIRLPSTALLTIDSKDRDPDYKKNQAGISSPYDFAIRKTESLMPGFITRLGVSEVVFPWTVPNINDKTYQIGVRIFHNTGSIDQTVSIDKGFYTPARLAQVMTTEIQALLTPLEYGDTIEFIYGTLKLPIFFYSLSTNQGTTIQFYRLGITDGYTYPDETIQLYNLLGFQGDYTPEGESEVGAFTLCQPIRYVDIVCNQLTNSQAQKDQTSQLVARDMLCRIYLADAGQVPGLQADASGFTPPGCCPTVIYRNFTTPKQIQWIPNQNIPGFLQFQVYDDQGDLLYTSLGGGDDFYGDLRFGYVNWSMTLLVSEC